MNYEQIFKNIDDILWKEAGCSSGQGYPKSESDRKLKDTKKF